MYEAEKKKLLSFFKPDVIEILKEQGAFCAGGAITSLFTNKEVNDLDIYFPSREALIKTLDVLYNELPYELICTNYTDKSILFMDGEVKIQFIYFGYFKTPEEIFSAFDFTVCMGAYSFKDEGFGFHQDFFKHNAQRYLKFNTGTAYPLLSALRVNKYQEKGYTISKTEYLRVIMSAMSLKLESWEDVKEHIGGFYGANVDEMFDEDKPFSVEEAVTQMSSPDVVVKTYATPQNVCYMDLIIAVYGDDLHLEWYKWVRVDEGKMVSRVVTGSLSCIGGNTPITYTVGETVNGGDNGIYCFNQYQDISRYSGDGYAMIELVPVDKKKFLINGNESQLLGDVLVKRVVPEEEIEKVREQEIPF